MRLAIFSDIHGKLLLPFKLVDHYQKTSGKFIDFILQCGDLGAYPDLNQLDKATIRHAQYDRDELGFHDDFCKVNPEINRFLEELDIPMICVRGNHEDHAFLDELEQKSPSESRFPIDIYRKVWMCKTGWKQTLAVRDETLTFVGIGRIGDRKQRSEDRFIQEYERRELRKLHSSKEHFDILISHDKDDSTPGYGMREIRELLDQVLFEYHFYGHTGEPFREETDSNGITRSIKVRELEFGPNGILPPGCMLILEKSGDGLQLEVLDQKWTNSHLKHHWKF